MNSHAALVCLHVYVCVFMCLCVLVFASHKVGALCNFGVCMYKCVCVES